MKIIAQGLWVHFWPCSKLLKHSLYGCQNEALSMRKTTTIIRSLKNKRAKKSMWVCWIYMCIYEFQHSRPKYFTTFVFMTFSYRIRFPHRKSFILTTNKTMFEQFWTWAKMHPVTLRDDFQNGWNIVLLDFKMKLFRWGRRLR